MVSSGNVVATMNADPYKMTVENVISNVNTVSDSNTTAGFIGTINNKAGVIIKNSAALGSVSGYRVYKKFTTASNDIVNASCQNCYENADAKGQSNANGTNIKAVQKTELLTKNFYIDTLGLDEAIWNLNNVHKEKQYTRLQTTDTVKTMDIIDLDLIF